MPSHEPSFYDLLEVAPSASREDIQVAYNRSRATFAQNSLAVYSLFSAEECQQLQQRIEEAYRTLMNEDARTLYDESIGLPPPRPRGRPVSPVLKPAAPPAVPVRAVVAAARPGPSAQPVATSPLPAREPAGGPPSSARAEAGAPQSSAEAGATSPSPAWAVPNAPHSSPARAEAGAPPSSIPEGAVVTGALLKKIREQQGIVLRDISRTTRVGLAYLQFIEEENFGQLPVPAYLRGFLKAYAKCVGLDPERVSADYIKLYSLYHEIKQER